ncbi:hypothetical protein BJ508DRAFT_337406 [Ascobolus immersus RN42]|uniref:Uncharacterized protein n=1 Tax=Ascobolus immersus RN42 TaxID=1160509 RepID=A0A3N4IQ92_ASCIM|nr:hypothetical protein BJ508DRAFT_337406 [Ascobolus immersus RN42]
MPSRQSRQTRREKRIKTKAAREPRPPKTAHILRLPNEILTQILTCAIALNKEATAQVAEGNSLLNVRDFVRGLAVVNHRFLAILERSSGFFSSMNLSPVDVPTFIEIIEKRPRICYHIKTITLTDLSIDFRNKAPFNTPVKALLTHLLEWSTKGWISDCGVSVKVKCRVLGNKKWKHGLPENWEERVYQSCFSGCGLEQAESVTLCMPKQISSGEVVIGFGKRAEKMWDRLVMGLLASSEGRIHLQQFELFTKSVTLMQEGQWPWEKSQKAAAAKLKAFYGKAPSKDAVPMAPWVERLCEYTKLHSYKAMPCHLVVVSYWARFADLEISFEWHAASKVNSRSANRELSGIYQTT